MKPMTILNVAYPLAPVRQDCVGGAEQVLARLDEALVNAGHRSLVVACEGSAVHGQLIDFPVEKSSYSDSARRAAELACRDAISRALRDWPADLVHLHGLDFPEYLPPPGIPLLATLHLPPDWYDPRIFQRTRPATYLNCVSLSQHRTCPQAEGLLVPIENGVPIPDSRNRISYDSLRKRCFAFILGRICPEKGFHLALDAARRAGFPLFIAGRVFPYEAHEHYFRREIIPRLDHARRFIGPVAGRRKARLLQAASCLLIASLAPETSSLVAMEALAAGTPVIAFRAGALPEIIDHGRTGYLVESSEEMANAIREVHRLDTNECREAARRRFSVERMTSQYLALYEQLIARHSSLEDSHETPRCR